MHENRRCDIVNPVGNYLNRQVRIFEILDMLYQVNFENVLVDTVTLSKSRRVSAKNRYQTVVNLKCRDLSCTLSQNSVKAPIPGPISMTLT